MNKEYIRRKTIADLSQQFSMMTNGAYEIIRYREKRPKDGYDHLIASIPLRAHPIYGETRIFINEIFLPNGSVEYHYGWEKLSGSKHTKHICAWGNEPHTGQRAVEFTEPYHHHHVPEYPSERKDCYYIRSLEDVMEFVQELILHEIQYTEDIKT